MAFITMTPTTVIPTNGSFVLDELYDMRVVQVGGTNLPYSTQMYYNNDNTYLYIKCIDETGSIKYAKVTIFSHKKIIIEDASSHSSFDETGRLKTKYFECHLTLCCIGTEYASPGYYDGELPIFNQLDKLFLTYVWDRENGVTRYPDIESIKSYFFPFVEFVDKPEPHVMYFSQPDF